MKQAVQTSSRSKKNPLKTRNRMRMVLPQTSKIFCNFELSVGWTQFHKQCCPAE